MPRPIFNSKIENNNLGLNAPKQKTDLSEFEKYNLDTMLRKPRSKKYVEIMKKLDVGGHTHNRTQVEELINEIRNELPEVELVGCLLGVVAKCYLGAPYEVHVLDLTGDVVEHYKDNQKLPNGLEKGRNLAMDENYAFIEVYTDCCRAISANGNVSIVKM